MLHKDSKTNYTKANSIEALLDVGAQILQQNAISRARLEAEILLGFVLGLQRVELHIFSNNPVESFFVESYFRLLKRRANQEPIEYLIEKVSFYGEELYISYGALIPRPETEILVNKALELIDQKDCKNIVEIGVGSGAISVLLAHLNKSLTKKDSALTLHASDISPEALFIAYVNKVNFKVDNLSLHHSSYLDFNIKMGLKFDLLISNPPYIKNGTLLPKSLAYEPQNALFGGERGDEMLHHIINLAYQNQIPYLLCEMGYDQRESIQTHLKEIPHRALEFYKDLAGLDRGFMVSF
ncbi:HemK/PrmC family methyltransferase [Helicobacter turcicus]|uniref:peptide chain release factor N(5)-glutamine methyltransferase n=1 Tax=Helicobacter turcicus TaxID=2867412 RepID=A0ABS7JNF8_9HELI|nr:HemK/PrmC family methyltransferase [Helicobacter turcicus]MBX7490917.1 peptide chain release factor N(5)-glutamine methyltransferase [Helicobacter turcicus]MBX7545771.1 peptide chain release factor N(5)-glutamine methyltransferase [Helicobacter turcicus]